MIRVMILQGEQERKKGKTESVAYRAILGDDDVDSLNERG
jgi:hypothetical protein